MEDTRFSELLPSRTDAYSHLRVFERCARLYSHFIGVKGGIKMGSSSFRSLTRFEIAINKINHSWIEAVL